MRVYRPEGLSGSSFPAVIYSRGGGWVIGSRDTYDKVCRNLAKAANCVVFSVELK